MPVPTWTGWPALPASAAAGNDGVVAWLFSRQSASLAYLTAAVLGMAFVALVFPLPFLAGHGAFFEQGDASQHVTGWLFFAQDRWHFPLLRTDRLNHPDGVVIAFTDSIPLAALFFKLLAAWLPARFHYIGWWHAVAFVTQAIGATFLIRSLGGRHLLGTLCAVAFALCSPALLWRVGHTSLLTHGLLLFALGCYLRGRHGDWPPAQAAIALIAACLVGLMIHPYFLAFCYALFLAFLLDQAIAGEGWMRQLQRLLVSVLVLAGCGLVLGYLGNGTTTFGFGLYSMNLTAPVCGSRFFDCLPKGAAEPFGQYHFIDATGGQYEGFNYLGSGLLLLLPLATIWSWRTVRALPRRYPALLAVLALCTLYALSNKIYFGHIQLLDVALPTFLDRLTGTFRASGRFFWVVGYALLFAMLAGVLKRRNRQAALLILAAMALQWVDVAPLRERITATASVPAVDDLSAWKPVLARVDEIHVYPAFGCGDADVKMYWFFQRLAAHYGKLLSTGYISRPNVDCAANDAGFAAPFTSRHLYVMPQTTLRLPFMVPAGFRNALQRHECSLWQAVLLCGGEIGAAARDQAALSMAPAPTPDSETVAVWPAAQLPTQIGKLVDGSLVATNAAGFLSYGPYVSLPAGRYRFGMAYRSNAASGTPVGRWDVVQNPTNQKTREFAAGALIGTAGQDARIDGIIRVEDAHAPIEVRSFFNGTGDLQLGSISIERIP